MNPWWVNDTAEPPQGAPPRALLLSELSQPFGSGLSGA